MSIRCVWEHNGDDTLLYAVDFPGAFSRGRNLKEAREKMKMEIVSYASWLSLDLEAVGETEIVQEATCNLEIRDADSDVLFDEERLPLTMEAYLSLKSAALKSAADFQRLYERIPDKSRVTGTRRKTFYGSVPRSAEEMYRHTKNVNAYYFGEIEVDADNEDTILSCRQRGFLELEKKPDFLRNPVIEGSCGEYWTVRKVLRRFIWHDRIHGKAMYRMAAAIWGREEVPDVFCVALLP